MKRVPNILWLLGWLTCSCGDEASKNATDGGGPDAVTIDGGADAAASLLNAAVPDPTDPRAIVFTPGVQQLGAAGLVRIALLSATPPPTTKGNGTWSLLITSVADGRPLSGLSLSVESSMPDHRHGTTAPVVRALATEGMYALEGMNLYMLGFWYTAIDVGLPNGLTDTVGFGFVTSLSSAKYRGTEAD